jgi:hypothetical protein
MRLRSCSKAIVLESEDIGAGTAAEAGAEEASCCSGFGFGFGFAETDAGTKDIIVVAGLGAAAGEAFAVGLA